MTDENNVYAKQFTDDSFWAKLSSYAKTAGTEVVEKALWLYYAFQRPETPIWAKATIIASLGYFISPIDAIPDLAPVVGYTDDLGVLAMAVTTVGMYIDDAVKALARKKLQEWFGD
jgi:uncharacterized membrane protein YkvA (DUF1232 family)